MKTSRYYSRKELNPFTVLSIFLHPEKLLHHPLVLASNSISPLFLRNYYSQDAIPSHRSRQIAQELATLFSTSLTPQNSNNKFLQNLGTNLTPATVETLLKDLKSWKIASQFFSWAAQQDGYSHNCYTYNAMASILSRARQKTPLQVLAKDMVNSRCPTTPGALGFFIRCVGSLGLVDEVSYVFDNAKTINCVPNVYTYNCLLEALAKSCRVDLVEKRFGEMVDLGMDVDKFTLTPVLLVYCNAGKFKEALSVFNRIYDNAWVDEHVFSILVVSFSKWGEVDKALELIQRMENYNMRLNEKTVCVLIHGFTKEKRVDGALLLFDKMKELGFSGDLPIFSVLIEGLCERKELGRALNLYVEMNESGIVPDVGLVTRLISGFCKERDFVTAERLLRNDGVSFYVSSLLLIYNAVLEGLVNHGEVDKAHFLIQAMIEPQKLELAQNKVAECVGNDTANLIDSLFRFKKSLLPDAVSFNVVIDGFCKNHKLDMALELLDSMVGMGCRGNLLIYNNLIFNLCSADRLEESYRLLKEMKESGFEPTEFTYNAILGYLCRQEDIPGVLDLVREMQQNGHMPWRKHYTMLVKQLCARGSVVEACNFLDSLVQAGIVPDIIAYSAAINGLCKIQDMDQALQLFRSLSANEHLPDLVAHNIIIGGFCKAGRISDAQYILDEMLEKGLVPSVVTYNLMIDGWCKTGRIDLALLCYSKMVEEARPPTVITYTTLIVGMCNAGKPDDALAVWKEMKGKGCAPNRIAYIALVNGLCKCGREDSAFEYFCKMEAEELEPDTFVYVTLINAFLSKGDSVLAFKLIKEMVQKGKAPGAADKNYPLLVDALYVLHEDEKTSSGVHNLIEEGCIPMINNIHDLNEYIKKS